MREWRIFIGAPLYTARIFVQATVRTILVMVMFDA
jgi:hypothetical protein